MTKGTLKINKMDHVQKFVQCRNEHIKTVELFFFNEHLSDSHLLKIAKGIKFLGGVDSLIADFGEYNFRIIF